MNKPEHLKHFKCFDQNQCNLLLFLAKKYEYDRKKGKTSRKEAKHKWRRWREQLSVIGILHSVTGAFFD